jgi:hypothetical protein
LHGSTGAEHIRGTMRHSGRSAAIRGAAASASAAEIRRGVVWRTATDLCSTTVSRCCTCAATYRPSGDTAINACDAMFAVLASAFCAALLCSALLPLLFFLPAAVASRRGQRQPMGRGTGTHMQGGVQMRGIEVNGAGCLPCAPLTRRAMT